jgi:ABC-type polysaccharide/polyol phosphate export permease
MEFFRSLKNNRKLIWQLGKNEFKNRFANTGLGAIWGFIQPFIFMLTYVIIFQYILKAGSPKEYPYIVWFLPGMSMWTAINESVINASGSIRTYSYLVKKVVFPIDVIPVIPIISSAIVSAFLLAISIIVGIIYGYIPNVLLLVYIIFAMYCFVLSFTRFTAAVCTMVPDFAQLLNILMQLFFWFTPIVWNLAMIDESSIISKIIKCMPFTYLVSGLRQAFHIDDIITRNYGLYTIVFWVITIFIFVWGNYIFKKNKKDFADVL